MTSKDDDLLPCPFCGGEAERIDFEAVEDDPNAGGSCISCKACGASSPVHFDRKENLYSGWNARRNHLSDEVREAMLEAEKALEFYAEPEKAKDRLGAPICVPDFYDELDFGDVARPALAKLRSVMK